MSTPTPSPLHRFIAALAITALLPAALVMRAHAVADNALTQHIWKLKYGVSDAQLSEQAPHAGWLNQDADGDGIKNKDEIAAGTNPFSPGSVVRITSITPTPSLTTHVDITFPTQDGKQYVVQGTPAMTSAFTNIGVTWDGVGGNKTLTVAKGTNKFFRILVQDMDTDNDGVGDWAEKAVTLTHTTATTVPLVNDYDYVRGQVYSDINTLTPRPNVVTIKAATPFASEDGPTAGSMTIERTMDLFPTTITYGVGGSTAQAGIDYQPLAGSVMLPARGPMSQALFVNPMAQATVKGSRSVTATLNGPGAGDFPFTLGSPNAATVIINPSTAATGSGLLARYYDTASGTYADALNFGSTGTYVFTRGVPTTTGTIVVTAPASQFAGLQVGHQVKLTFTSGNAAIDNATYDHQNFPVTNVNTGGGTFSVSITSGTSFGGLASTSGNCSFSIQSIPHPPVIERIDEVVNNDWVYGTPNDVAVTPNNPVDNYSTVFEGYLHPTTAGNYQFQLDADDKARVLLDTNLNGVFDLPGEEILEHGWDGITTPEVIGTFKVSGTIPLVVPGGAATRYKIRVEHVETTGAARCRLQWRLGTAGFANIPQANVFSHTRALTNYTVNLGVATINTAVAHGLTAGVSNVTLYFSSGSLFTPPANYSGTYTVQTTPTTTSFTISVPGAANSGAAAGLMVDTTSTTTGWLSQVFTNTAFTAPAGYVNILGGGATNANNGIWGSGTPDPLIGKDTFSVRWTGQVQPQFTEDYTFVVHADDGSSLWINGQLQEMKTSPSTNTGGATYSYNNGTGDVVVTYTNMVIKPDNFVAGESVRVDPSSGNLTHGTGSTYTYDGVLGVLTVDYSNLANITPGGFTVGETIELDPTSGSLTTLATLPYVITSEPSPSTFTVDVAPGIFDSQPVVTVPNAATTAGSNIVTVPSTAGLSVGMRVTGTGLPANEFITAITPPNQITITTGTGVTTEASTTLTCTSTINIADTRNALVTAVTSNTFTFNVGSGKYSTGTGNINIEIANKPLKEWSSMGNERYCRIPMIGGTRYDIRLDYWENGGYSRCALYWYSPSQPKQIIPKERLYPSNLVADLIAKGAHISPTQATALVGGPFSLPIAGSNGATVSVSGLPPGLSFAGGVISGTPTTAGDYQILITITNAAGTSTSVLNLHVEQNTGTVVREYWDGQTGTTVADMNTTLAITGTANLNSLEAPTDFGDSYSARVRGYITAPLTGNYYFWIASSNASELWISNDDEPINAFKRAWVTTGNPTPQTWNGELTQKSPWLSLVQGRKYYFEILHKAGVGLGDNLAVGWLKPGQSGTAPSEVVPGYALSPYVAPAPGSTPGTLYVATMLSQGGVATNGVGSATLRLSEDENVVNVSFDIQGFLTPPYKGLTGIMTDWHVHNDPYLTHGASIMYDPNDFPVGGPAGGLQPDGSHKWVIPPLVGTMTKAEVIALLKQGKAYINIHTNANLNGEIRGNFTLANGSRTFTAPPPAPAWTDDSNTNNGASRFLTQATFGASTADIAALKALAATSPVPAMPGVPASRYNTWIDNQFAMAADPNLTLLKEVIRTENASAQGGAFNNNLVFNAWWWRSITAPDQLRQRVAFALSEIHVVSAQGPLDNNALATSHFYDTLANGVPSFTTGAFGNFRDILEDTTLTPGMGRYLDMLRNDKPDPTLGRIPNENYAREIKQLFSIGLYRMWPNGTLMLTSKDNPIDTYKQPEIVGFAHVFTGWDYGYDGAHRPSFSAAANWTRPMRAVPARHYTGPKLTLNNEVLPGLTTLGGQPLDPIATHTANNYNSSAYEMLPVQELDATHDQLFNHPNTGPFICRQLIQRLVMSHPSPDYVYRVVQKFNNNGFGVRGDMKAVIKAILLDFEARSNGVNAESLKPAYGKQREPVMRVAAAARAFRTTPWTGTYSQSGTRTITVNVTAGGPHGLENGDTVFLDFTSGSPAPWIGTYGAGTPLNATSFTVQAAGWNNGTYSQTGGSNVMTVTMGGHWLQTGHQVYIDFTSGASPADGVYTVASSATTDNPNAVNSGTFTLTMPDTTARSGNLMIPRFTPGSYTVSASGLPAPNDRRVTMDTNFNHELTVGQQVQINFFDGNPLPVDRVATVEQVIDLNTWTFLAPSAGSNLSTLQGNNSVYQFPLQPLPMTRNGNVGNRASTFQVNSTTLELEQTPINSPTVFNFFLPDYKFPGTLQSQGITTPEFELTAETTVVRQSNYLYSGIFGSNNVNGINSFNNGNHALVMDFFPWYGNATGASGPGQVLGAGPQTGQTWTSNANLSTLVDRLNTLLLGENMSTDAKNIVLKFLDMRAITAISQQNPCRITSAGHNLNTGDVVVISGVTGGTFSATINATHTITKIDNNVFSVPVNCTSNVGIVYTNAVAPVVPYNNTAPTDTNKRDRLRAILHFILTSPEYTIQR